ncbi:PREDICTED: mitochondrial 2-oxoglutarate/malate carrier protein-like [Cyphomyrmex costatus]|uniref:Mitochondrial 2-oxoglutarate/malate carrier protein n=1 Tax=Cyphomyrmex costatus TaxID=456900 RepID=A0A195CVT5_9HYME|nr:PREDICTED: mitochondrial 2-oxoglutarate/malate carrier protein-like [Cyphomyrmex costatus]KYN04269.1 Mitochondrial 2-oxoglutarate/malate carrier protein [Cyphomyrmex costatus]
MSKKEEEPKEKKKQPIPPIINFLLGGLSGMAGTCVVHPMDVIKNRMQMHKGKASILNVISTIYSKEGITTFYSGLTAGLVRQATYTTVRLGIYNQMQDFWRQRYISRPSFAVLAFMAGTAGAVGAFVGTPADVALVRMTTDGRLPVEQRRNYKNVLDAFVRIAREEGIFTLWRGSVATIGRAVVVNVSQLATYSQVKHLISSRLNVKEGIGLHFGASMVSGFVTAFNSMPFDITKTRIQNMKSTEKPPGMISVMMSIAKNEGMGALWKGFWPTYCRIGPHTVLTLVINEQLMRLYRTYVNK